MPTRVEYAPLDVPAARAALAAGRSVRVGIKPTHQFPDGAAGRVRDIRDEQQVGPEFIDVEVSIGGARDVIPFAPADLTPLKRGETAPAPVATRGRQRRSPMTKPETTNGSRAPKPAATKSSGAAELEPKPATTNGSRGAEPATTNGSPRSTRTSTAEPTSDIQRVVDDKSATGPALAGSAAQRDAADPAPPAVSKGRSVPRSARSAPSSVQLRIFSTDPENASWDVELEVNGRVVGKRLVLPPTRVWAAVQQLGVPAVEKAVSAAFATHRQCAQDRADRLAGELAAARAELAAYPPLP